MRLFILTAVFFSLSASPNPSNEDSFDESSLEDVGDFDEDFFLFDEELEDIACSDLPEAFKEILADNDLRQSSMIAVLREVTETLKKLKTQSELSQSELDQKITELEDMLFLAMDNQFTMLEKTDNFSYFLENCSNEL